MKKKISSLITAVFVLLMCVFASACGDRYKNLEFKVSYAFSADAKEEDWHDASEGISLNYAFEDDGSKDESLLIFDDYGATIYLRVEVRNVKSRHVDKITVSPTSTAGLDFSSVMVKNKQVFPVQIVGNVNSSFKVYENNSGKKMELPIEISRKLEAIEADPNLKPAMPLTSGGTFSTLSLVALNNLTYQPEGLTNQIGVKYSVQATGYYAYNTEKGEIEFIPVRENDIAEQVVTIENGILKIINGVFFESEDSYVIRVKATSVFHDGSVEGTSPIETVFDVYVVDSVTNLKAPKVLFNNGNKVEKVHIYENGEGYSTSTIMVDTTELKTANLVYNKEGGVYIKDGKVAYTVAVYVLDQNGKYVKCDFDNQSGDGTVGVNGLFVKRATVEGFEEAFTLSISTRDVMENKIKIAYELEGFDYSQSSMVDASTEINVVKDAIPTGIIVNDTITLKQGDEPLEADIYSTSNENYKGLQLKFAANPNGITERKIEFVANPNLKITNSQGEEVAWVYSGETVFIKFVGNISSTLLNIKTLNVPEIYDGVDITEPGYLTVSYEFTKCVTADSFEFVANSLGATLTGNALIDANEKDSIFVKVYYSGETLVTSTISLESVNPKVKFANGKQQMSLSDAIKKSTISDHMGKYDIYEIPLGVVGSIETSEITIFAGDESFNINKSVNIETVNIMSEENEELNVDTLTVGVKEFSTEEVNNGSFNFAIARGETVHFVVTDTEGNIETISNIVIEKERVEHDSFSVSLFEPLVISNSTLEVIAYVSGKTQVLRVYVTYYILDTDVGSPTYDQIITRTQIIKIEIAVFDSIGNITRNLSQQSIGYVNSYYDAVSSSEVAFTSYTSNNGTPSDAVVFTNGEGSIVSIGGASQVKVGFVDADYQTIKQTDGVDIYYTVSGEKISLLSSNGTVLVDTKGTATTTDDVNILNGTFVISLNKAHTGLKDISLTLTALRFGIISNISVAVRIEIAEVDKAERIEVDGDFIQTSETSKELQMSFMDVVDNGNDIAEFKAGLGFKTPTVPKGMIRFDDVDTSLTYMLYRYQLDENGNFKYDANGNVKYSRINNDFFDVLLEDSKVEIKAYKNRGGGLFKLVLATKDSYNQATVLDESSLDEAHFDTKYELTIRVSDGSKTSAYVINNTEDLKAINYNLDKHFVLSSNIGEDEIVNIQPLGLSEVGGNNVVKPFTGSLNGQFTTVINGSQEKTTSYSIRLRVEQTVVSADGYLAGLFGILNADAEVRNLKLIVNYATSFESKDVNGLHVGSLAGINKGKIDNVQVSIEQPEGEGYAVGFISDEGVINFGGLVGKNEGEISHIKSESYTTLQIKSNEYQTHNIGLVAGLNDVDAEISGSYLGKESLNNYIYDIVANLEVKNFNEFNDGELVKYYVGAVAGANAGLIKGLLVGGQITMSTEYAGNLQAGAIGGIVGLNNKEVKLSTALSLNITSTSTGVNVGGIAGNSNNGVVDTVKFVSATTKINGSDIYGILSGKHYVGGVVGNATGGTINYASVESFIDDYTINNVDETATAGIAYISGTDVENSFVRANVKGQLIYVTTNSTEKTNTYFIGNFLGAKVEGYNPDYYFIVENEKLNNAEVNISDYMVDVAVDDSTTDWKNIYYVDGGNFVKATSYVDGKTYKQFNVELWTTYVYGLVGLTTPEQIEENKIWLAEENYNTVNIKGVEVFLPYIVREESEPLMIVKPQSISASINDYYYTSTDSVYVDEFDYSKYENLVKETLIVNFFKDAGDEANAHYLFKNKDGSNKGLLDLSLLPEDEDPTDSFDKGAQGGYAYEIVGDGHNYAYINSKKQIVFTRASNQTPIIVRVYSVFNTKIEIYVAFYSQSLLTDLTLNSSSVFYANEADYKYEFNAYTGQSNKVVSLGAENKFEGENYQNILDIENLSQYLYIHDLGNEEISTSHGKESKLEINKDNIQSVTLKVRDNLTDDERIGADEYEIITFKLFLRSAYFGKYDDGKKQFVQDDVLIGQITLRVNLYNSATAIDVNGSDSEITTADDMSLTVTLTTQFVKTDKYNPTNVETLKVNGEGELYNEVEEGDSIRIKFEILEGEEELNRLCEDNEKQNLAELFLENAQMIGSLYKAQDGTVLGYRYNIFLELEDSRIARYIENNIKFNIIVYAASNSEINNENSPIEILLKPATLESFRMENYVVQSLKMHTDYTDYVDIVTNKDIETSIIEPGGLGNVMIIYLEPSYAKVTSASIKTSELYVPSLGKTVQVKFTQLALDYRTDPKGVLTTLSGEKGNNQVGDTLELNRLSEIDRNGKEIYTGVIRVRIHIEEPFVGMEASLKISINVKTETNPEGVTRHRDLLTSYLPGTEISYDEDRAISDGYLIQKGTSDNVVTLEIYGYQFNSNPSINFSWVIEGTSYKYYDGKPYEIYHDANGNNEYDEGETRHLTGNYIYPYLTSNFADAVYNSHKDSYTLKLKLNISDTIPAPFKLSAELYLSTKDGQIKTSYGNENTLIFYPTEYILNSINIAGLPESGRKNIAINQTKSLEIEFETDNKSNALNLNETIYNDLLQAYNHNESSIAKLFTYYKGGEKDFTDSASEFIYSLIYQESTSKYIISITGVERFNSLVRLKLDYAYKFVDGEYVVEFGSGAKTLSTTFTLNIIAEEQVQETIVYSAEDIYNSATGQWSLVEGGKYVLVNDIELENVVPITTKIGSFDGNNRVISIKSFKVDPEATEFGLFANIGTYTVEDPLTEKTFTHQTILKNMIIDYSKFDGTLALNNNINQNLVFGGLVARNNGGLIYNCDVMNLNPTETQKISIIVGSQANLTFGGLIGENNGIVTNSRVGRTSYTKVTATPTTENTVEKYAGGLTFEISNQIGIDDVNQFQIIAGGFVGSNSGTIASSYISNTNLKNHSTNETTNLTAGFVGSNSGTISYSYAKADDKTITTANPLSTGYVVENLGNGIVSGFVHNNTGTIHNSYSNIELKTESAYISGFVYNNTGTISESYAATTMNSGSIDTIAEQPFIGVDSKGELLSNGTLENTYYLMRSSTDNPYTEGNKDVAQALNEENFQNSEYLVGFAFVLSNSKVEREQGIWSYYTTTNKKRVLPELMNANVVSHSYRYVYETVEQEKVLRNAVSFAEGTVNNPYIISNVEEFNNVFTEYGANRNLVGNVRFINNINFNDDETAIQTRSNYTLGSSSSSTRTSVEGNGMTINGIYLDVGDSVVNEIGLFAEIQNAYVKNLNLKFATPKTDGQFSTTTAMYSGGLAGKIEDSAIINISLDGANTTLTGSNFVGGVAGLISGNSLVYGIETNLNVKASGTEDYLYYNEEDFDSLNIRLTSHYDYPNYLKHLSYAGGVAGVLDLEKRSNIEYNVQFIDVRGDQMSAKTFAGNPEANILAEYAGGVAGYASAETESFKLRYFMGQSENIRGDFAVGGLYGVNLGGILASQVTAEEDTQYDHDTAFGNYIKEVEAKANGNASEYPELNIDEAGNLNLLEGSNYVGGLVGVGLDVEIKSSYSKATIKSGKIVGGLVGLNVAGVINYSYAIPYVNYYEDLKSVGGLIGETYSITTKNQERNSEISTYETLLKLKGVINKVTDVQFTYSSILADVNDARFRTLTEATFDYICADYDADNSACLSSNNNSSLMYVYAGKVPYAAIKFDVDGTDLANLEIENNTNETNKSSNVDLFRLYNVGDPDQTIAFQEVFSGWSLIKYWTLNDEKYFPLLNNEAVDNYIEIDDQNDLAFIRTNPNGKFKVIKDFVIDATKANWVVGGKFTGVLVGELESDDRRPTITINGLIPTLDNATAGFFEETHNATISNLSFVWSNTNDAAIDLHKEGVEKSEALTHISMVSGLTCRDENSLISNVEVRTSNSQEYIINEETKTIGGFGGIVGYAKNTNILGSNFVGKVKANLTSSATNDVYVGGAVGYVETGSESGDSAVINSVLVGAERENSSEFSNAHYPITSFDLTISENTTKAVYIGGSVGKASNAAIASNNVGGMSYADGYKQIDITVKLEEFKNRLYLGGVVGYAQDGLIASCESSTNISISGNVTNNGNMIKVGGLAGEYDLGNPLTTTGISKSNSYSNIEVKTLTSTTQTMLSTGVAQLSSKATVKQCLFTGAIDTEGSNIEILYAGGVSAIVNANKNVEHDKVEINEVTTDSILIVGTTQTKQLYAGGLVGFANKLKVSYCASLGRIVPITSDTATNIYAGGLIGLVGPTENEKVRINANNSYTLSSMVADSISDSAIANLNVSALIGGISDAVLDADRTTENFNFSKVFYSSDYALCTDENQVENAGNNKVYLGTNLSATTMIRTKVWHDDLNTENGQGNVWAEFNINNVARLPYLASLEEQLIEFGILTKETGKDKFDYVEGSAMRPVEITSEDDYSFDEDVYKYYLLVVKEKSGENPPLETTPELDGALNGILIGVDKDIDLTFRVGELAENADVERSRGIVSMVKAHSAISNLHVVIDREINVKDITGIITGLNQGVIYNCSVQGNGIKLKESGSFGLIAGKNTGLISHSFSSAEIILAETVQVGGIVHTNEGKLLSNYFTGYIEGPEAAGIVYAVNGGYIYNNYMAGVLTTIKENAFHACASIVGSNNFIDYYVDLDYAHKADKDETTLKSVLTSDLMANNVGLKGDWYTTVKDGVILETEQFGKNYNYPVYRFNRHISTDNSNLSLNEFKDQLYTGTGIPFDDEDPNEDKDLTLEERYKLLLPKEKETQNYKDAFKIPHLGVLTAVQNLLDKSRNYVVIYNIDGQYDKNKYETWTALGTNDMIGGFKPSMDNGVVVDEFRGVFVSNRYYAYSTIDIGIGEAVGDEYREIKNLSEYGLFNNVKDAYIGNIKLGSFVDLKNKYDIAGAGEILVASGALGTRVVNNNVIVNNIEFLPNSTISGNGYYGGLFGEVVGKLTVHRIVTGEERTSNVRLLSKGTNDIAGLIAGKLSGLIDLIDVKNKDNKLISKYHAWFNGNTYAGGVVGEILSGSIDAHGNTIKIIQTNRSGEDVDMYTTVLGGVAGNGYGNIDNIKVNFANDAEIKANAFGGAIGKVVGGETNIVGFEITGDKVKFVGNTDKDRFYGLIAGSQEGTIIANKDAMTQIKFGVQKFEVDSNSGKSYNDNAINEDGVALAGVGAVVGANQGHIIDTIYEFNSKVDLIVNGVPNVGSIIGYLKVGTATGQIKMSKTNAELTVSGTTNVGGLFGYLNGNITAEQFAEQGSDLIYESSGNVTVEVNGSRDDSGVYKNFGGLFGKWTGTNKLEGVVITNKNNVYAGTEGKAYNIGGVAGIIETTEEIVNLLNGGKVGDCKNTNYYSKEEDDLIEINSAVLNASNELIPMTKLINVGGIVGYAYLGDEKPTIKFKDIYNEKDALISGYQNVGGIVGYAKKATIINENSLIGYMANIKVDNDTLEVFYDVDDNNERNLIKNTLIFEPNLKELISYIYTDMDINFPVEGLKEEIAKFINGEGFDKMLRGNVYGVINVGGAVGCAGDGVELKNTVTFANVYGNTNVGGLVGLADNAQLTNNYVLGDLNINNEVVGKVKGVYYNFVKIKTAGSNPDTEENTFIPTGVGGLTGTSANSAIAENVLAGVNITSTLESVTEIDSETGDIKNQIGVVINKNNNYMADVALGELNRGKLEKFTNAYEIYNLDEKGKIQFSTLTSGFGGFVGSIDTATLLKATGEGNIENNKIINTNVDAQLGVNVGAYYGAYKFDTTISTESMNVAVLTPEIMGEINVDGAYNIGGIVGFIDGGASSFNLSNNSDCLAGKATISVQKQHVGIHVGGLIGKTNVNAIKGLKINNTEPVKIKIYTDNCYNVGGLIGRAEVSSDATMEDLALGKWEINNKGTEQTDDDSLDLLNTTSDDIYVGDNKENFGAFIGLLKVGKAPNEKGGFTITVKGDHKMPFTINTIENTNYHDGDSRFNSDEDETGITLYAEAYYINKDTFNIVGSKDTTLYDNENDTNPLNSLALGWSKQYTGFRQLQRSIPRGANQNNGYSGTNEWDSIAVIFDAAKITQVGTIGNLGLWKDENGDNVNDNEYQTSKDGKERLAKDHIAFTIYEQSEGLPTLYSAMGIASLMYESQDYVPAEKKGGKYPEGDYYYLDETIYQYLHATVDGDGKIKGASGADLPGNIELYIQNEDVFETPYDNTGKWYYWLLGLLTEQSPPQEYYIDANFNDSLLGLSYFQWGKDDEWTSYATVGNKNQERSSVTMQDKIYDSGSEEGKALVYFVPNYYGLNKENGGAKYKEYYGNTVFNDDTDAYGAYFMFDVIYENASLNGLNPGKEDTVVTSFTDSHLPKSGSIFEVSGIYSETAYKVKTDGAATDVFGLVVKAAWFVADVVAMYFTLGGSKLFTSGFKAAKFGMKKFTKNALKQAIGTGMKAATKHAWRSLKKNGFKNLLRLSAVVVANIIQVTSQIFWGNAVASYTNFTKPSDMNFGFLSETYSREIYYDLDDGGKAKLSAQTDYEFTNAEGVVYYRYSSIRPADYNSGRYIGLEIEFKDQSSWTDINSTSFNKDSILTLIDIPAYSKDEYKDQNYVPVPSNLVYNGTVKVKGQDEADADATEEQIGIVNNDGTYKAYFISKKYELRNGEYYINSNAGEIELREASLGFTPETYTDVYGTQPYKGEPNFIEYGSKYYVHGEFSDGKYTYSSYPGNNLEYSGGNYTINGVSISAETATHTATQMRYQPVYSEPETYDIEGYDYFKTVYFTANGTSGLKINGEGNELVRYAKFEYVEDLDASEDYSDLGTKGVDYIVQEYTYNGTKPDPSGDHLEIKPNVYQPIRDEYRYNKVGELYEQSNNGNYLKVGESYYLIEGGKRYSKNPKCYGIFKITSESASASDKTKFDEDKFKFVEGDDIVVPIYPSTFVNPYISNISHVYTKYSVPSVYWVHTKEPISALTFNPTYYIYEGGYTTDIDGGTVEGYPIVYVQMNKMQIMRQINEETFNEGKGEDPESNFYYTDGTFYYLYNSLYIQEYDDDSGEIVPKGNKTTISFKQLIDGWNTYKDGWYLVNQEQPLDEIYQVKDGKLYQANSQYTLNKDGLLSKISLKHFEGDATVYENMYLTNKEFGIYTRYKYTSSEKVLNLKNVSGWNKNLIPSKASSTMINGGKPTRLVESAKVILSGGYDAQGKPLDREMTASKTKDNTTMVKPGCIIIK